MLYSNGRSALQPFSVICQFEQNSKYRDVRQYDCRRLRKAGGKVVHQRVDLHGIENAKHLLHGTAEQREHRGKSEDHPERHRYGGSGLLVL